MMLATVPLMLLLVTGVLLWQARDADMVNDRRRARWRLLSAIPFALLTGLTTWMLVRNPELFTWLQATGFDSDWRCFNLAANAGKFCFRK